MFFFDLKSIQTLMLCRNSLEVLTEETIVLLLQPFLVTHSTMLQPSVKASSFFLYILVSPDCAFHMWMVYSHP